MIRSARRLAQAVLAGALALVPASAASAEVVEAPVPLASAANGIAAGADGNVYVVEPSNGSVAVLSPTGQLVRRVALANPGATAATSAALGPDGRVWVSISARQANGGGFRRIDPSGTVSSQQIPLDCGPTGLTSYGAKRILFTAPDTLGVCGASRGVGGINADGTGSQGGPQPFNAFDLAAVGNELFVPDFDGNVVRRYPIDPGTGLLTASDATFPIAGFSGADGIEVGPGGLLYITMFGSGQVVRLDPVAPNGTAPALVASGLQQPFGMAMGADGALYVASQDARLLRIASDGGQRSIALPAGFAAWQVARNGNDIWVTDSSNARALRIRNAGLPEPAPVTSQPPPSTMPPPVQTTTPPPTATTPATKPKVADVVSLASPKRCVSKRRLTLTVRKPKAGAATVRSIRVTVGKGKAKTYTAGKLKVPVALTGLPKGTFKVRLSVRLSDGRTLTETRTYRTCAPKAKKGHRTS